MTRSAARPQAGQKALSDLLSDLPESRVRPPPLRRAARPIAPVERVEAPDTAKLFPGAPAILPLRPNRTRSLDSGDFRAWQAEVYTGLVPGARPWGRIGLVAACVNGNEAARANLSLPEGIAPREPVLDNRPHTEAGNAAHSLVKSLKGEGFRLQVVPWSSHGQHTADEWTAAVADGADVARANGARVLFSEDVVEASPHAFGGLVDVIRERPDLLFIIGLRDLEAVDLGSALAEADLPNALVLGKNSVVEACTESSDASVVVPSGVRRATAQSLAHAHRLAPHLEARDLADVARACVERRFMSDSVAGDRILELAAVLGTMHAGLDLEETFERLQIPPWERDPIVVALQRYQRGAKSSD